MARDNHDGHHRTSVTYDKMHRRTGKNLARPYSWVCDCGAQGRHFARGADAHLDADQHETSAAED
jgi:hypothetical protein